MKWIGQELLKRDGKTIKDLAKILEPQGLSYRTIYAFFNRGGGTLELAAKIAKGMGRTLDEIYVSDDYEIPLGNSNSTQKTLSTNDENERIIDGYDDLDVQLDVLISSERTPDEVRKAAIELRNKRWQMPFKSGIFSELCVAYLTANPDDLQIISDDILFDFFLQCKSENAERVVTSITDRYTDSAFALDNDTLTRIGIQLTKSGFYDDSVSFFERAGEII